MRPTTAVYGEIWVYDPMADAWSQVRATLGIARAYIATELMPDVVILDDEMPGARGLQLLEWITSEQPDMRVVMYTLDSEVCDSARHLGAAGCVLKDANYEVLVRAVHNAAASLPRSAETH